MALTLVLVSFSCTGPIIGNLLVIAARGSYYGPLLGMFGFSLALALPFAFFAFFPGKLNMLGKSGGWLNAVIENNRKNKIASKRAVESLVNCNIGMVLKCSCINSIIQLHQKVLLNIL